MASNSPRAKCAEVAKHSRDIHMYIWSNISEIRKWQWILVSTCYQKILITFCLHSNCCSSQNPQHICMNKHGSFIYVSILCCTSSSLWKITTFTYGNGICRRENKPLIYKCSAAAEMSDHLATIHMHWKVGGYCALSTGGVGSPSNRMSPGPRPTSVPSGILINPAVWPQ